MTNQYAPTDVIVEVTRTTPQMARQWLTHNSRNRELSRSTVEDYKFSMHADTWHFTGETIVFDEDGVLNNGQHTLTAIAEMPDDYSIDILVVMGVSAESQQYSDQGRKRSLANLLTINGMTKNATEVASIGKNIYLWNTGLFFQDLSGRTAATRMSTSNVTLHVWLQENPKVEEWVGVNSAALRRVKTVRASALGAALFIVEQASPTLGRQFVERYLSLNRTDADVTLKALDRQFQQYAQTKVSTRDIIGTVFLAWNAWARGRQKTSLGVPRQIVPEGMSKARPRWTADTFPRPVEGN